MICAGCQPNRTDSKGPIGAKHKPSPIHHCQGNGCLCDLCNQQMVWKPVTEQQFNDWRMALAKLGRFYIGNTKILIQMGKQKKLKPNMQDGEEKPDD